MSDTVDRERATPLQPAAPRSRSAGSTKIKAVLTGARTTHGSPSAVTTGRTNSSTGPGPTPGGNLDRNPRLLRRAGRTGAATVRRGLTKIEPSGNRRWGTELVLQLQRRVADTVSRYWRNPDTADAAERLSALLRRAQLPPPVERRPPLSGHPERQCGVLWWPGTTYCWACRPGSSPWLGPAGSRP